MRRDLEILVLLASVGGAVRVEAAPPGDDRIVAVETRVPRLDFSSGVPWAELGVTPGASRLEDRMESYAVPGVGLALIEHGELAWARGYGVLNAADSARVGLRTVFEAASTTKFVTAVVVLELAARGELDLDGDVHGVLRSWSLPGSEWTTREKVTARRLLRHTAGINRPDGGFSIQGGGVPTLAQVLSGTAPADNLPAVIECEPGSRHQYSNFGYLILQQLLEDSRRMPFSRIVEEILFDPLRLTDSGFEPDAIPAPLNRPRPHDSEGRPQESSLHPTALAQGGLWSTPTDLARITTEILAALGGAADTAIRPEAARGLLEDPLAVDPDENMGFPLEGTGTFLLPCREGVALCHPGFNAPGATCLVIAFPQTGQGAVVMTNGANGLQLSLEILAAASTAYGWPRIEVPAPG